MDLNCEIINWVHIHVSDLFFYFACFFQDKSLHFSHFQLQSSITMCHEHQQERHDYITWKGLF